MGVKWGWVRDDGNGVCEASIKKTVKDSKGVFGKRVAESDCSVAEHWSERRSKTAI